MLVTLRPGNYALVSATPNKDRGTVECGHLFEGL
jgi:hypothetical protein